MSLASLASDLNKTVLFGSRQALKAIREGKASHLYLSADCPPQAQQLEAKAKEAKLKVIKLPLTKTELQEFCKKHFPITVITVLKPEVKQEE